MADKLSHLGDTTCSRIVPAPEIQCGTLPYCKQWKLILLI